MLVVGVRTLTNDEMHVAQDCIEVDASVRDRAAGHLHRFLMQNLPPFARQSYTLARLRSEEIHHVPTAANWIFQ